MFSYRAAPFEFRFSLKLFLSSLLFFFFFKFLLSFFRWISLSVDYDWAHCSDFERAKVYESVSNNCCVHCVRPLLESDLLFFFLLALIWSIWRLTWSSIGILLVRKELEQACVPVLVEQSWGKPDDQFFVYFMLRFLFRVYMHEAWKVAVECVNHSSTVDGWYITFWSCTPGNGWQVDRCLVWYRGENIGYLGCCDGSSKKMRCRCSSSGCWPPPNTKSIATRPSWSIIIFIQ